MLTGCAVGAAHAHPHVFVTTKAAIVFNSQGEVTAIKQSWTFDDMYSSFVLQGLADAGKTASREVLAPLAKSNVDSLAELGYYTLSKMAGKELEYGTPTDAAMEENPDKTVTLYYTLPLKEPASAKKSFSVKVYDPTFFVDFEVTKGNDAVTLINAPKGCSASVIRPGPLMANETQELAMAKSENFALDAAFSIKLASQLVVACP
ncbi:DUF1007 family protein [Methylovirgula sp. 4M-Z18]|uniref:DUF1007 family protein n=1 Tax=Methylovirgula sp. 4M-Z18 TaxID=2293567 RepID=UPI0013148314|nr:DUF1007 family protein [Methylovirgula sp. 4M-Z18]